MMMRIVQSDKNAVAICRIEEGKKIAWDFYLFRRVTPEKTDLYTYEELKGVSSFRRFDVWTEKKLLELMEWLVNYCAAELYYEVKKQLPKAKQQRSRDRKIFRRRKK